MSMIHMSNTAILTMLTWNDMNCDLEWFYGPEPQQSKYGLPLLQAETSGRQSGCIPYAFAIIENCKTPAEQRIAERTKFGAMMTHEIRINFNTSEIQKLAKILFGFGYGLAGIVDSGTVGETVYNYWDEKYPAACDQPLVKSLLVKRGEELLLLVCSWDKEPCKATFAFDTKALGLTLTTARDAEGTIEEQVAGAKAAVEEARKKIAPAKAKLADIQKRFDAKQVDENQLKAAQGQVTQAEAGVKNAETLVAVVENAANLPLKFNARKATLTVGLEGYGVRMLRLK
jgi:hypothetical protein